MKVKVNNTKEWDNFELKINHSEKFWKATHTVSDYLKELPLTAEQNDHLIKLLLDHMDATQMDAFVQGFMMGREFTSWEAAHED